MTVTLTWQTIVTAGAVIAAVVAIATTIAKGVRWVDHQREQDREIETLRKDTEDELCLITYGLLACLKGLKEQGCNGPVTEAIGKIEKHINQRAHNQGGTT